MLANSHRQRGEGRAGLLIANAVIGVGFFVGFRYIPVKITAYEFRDELRQEARYGAVRDDDKMVLKRLRDKADELDIPLREKDLTLRRTPTELVIKASYDQPIDFKVTTYVYKFSAEERAPLF
jgi:hypothetical protein